MLLCAESRLAMLNIWISQHASRHDFISTAGAIGVIFLRRKLFAELSVQDYSWSLVFVARLHMIRGASKRQLLPLAFSSHV